jgi:hypothetical protein
VPHRDTHLANDKFHIEAITAAGRPTWVVVSPQGNRLYSFSDRPAAEAEATLLNEPPAAPRRRRVKHDDVIPDWAGADIHGFDDAA